MQTPFDKRENNFDFIRLALAVLVIFSHSYPIATATESNEPMALLTRHQATAGDLAVDLFFIISGFLITASFERSSTLASYMKKRVARIYPGFIVAMLFCAFFVLPMSGGHLLKTSAASQFADFSLQTLRLQEFHYAGAFANNPAPGPINGSTWSIQYEFWCYIGVVVLGIAGILRSNRLMIALFSGSIMLGVLFAIFKWTPGGKMIGIIFGYPPFWARLLPMYLAGMVFYRMRTHIKLTRKWIVWACALLVVAAQIPYGWPLLFPVVGAYLVLALAYHPALRLHGWSRYGDFSYGTYLYAFPIQQLVMQRIGPEGSPVVLFILATPATLVCAIASWHGVERWFLQRAHKPAKVPAHAPARDEHEDEAPQAVPIPEDVRMR